MFEPTLAVRSVYDLAALERRAVRCDRCGHEFASRAEVIVHCADHHGTVHLDVNDEATFEEVVQRLTGGTSPS